MVFNLRKVNVTLVMQKKENQFKFKTQNDLVGQRRNY